MIIQTIRMKSVTAEGMGTLSVFEAEHDVPFAIKRIYYIHNVPAGVQRGGHAHKKLRQLLWCPYGKILIKLDDGFEKAEVMLDRQRPDRGKQHVARHAVAAGQFRPLRRGRFLL